MKVNTERIEHDTMIHSRNMEMETNDKTDVDVTECDNDEKY